MFILLLAVAALTAAASSTVLGRGRVKVKSRASTRNKTSTHRHRSAQAAAFSTHTVTTATGGTFSIFSEEIRDIDALSAADTMGPYVYNYYSLPVTTCKAGKTIFGQSSAPVDTLMIVYKDSFDPTSPTTNVLQLNDDASDDDAVHPAEAGTIACLDDDGNDDPSDLCPLVQLTAEPSKKYILVISTYLPVTPLTLPLTFYASGSPVFFGEVGCGCPFTCTAATGSAQAEACTVASGTLDVDASATCKEGFGVTKLDANKCTTAGTTVAFTCAYIADPQNFERSDAFIAWAETNSPGYPSLANPTSCNTQCAGNLSTQCSAAVTARFIDQTLVPRCTSCFQCTGRRQQIIQGGGSGQVLFTCPEAANTAAKVNTCFQYAACMKLVTSADTCNNRFNNATTCPPCPSQESKKGLLGLLGLLGIIPLAMCSLLLGCLILCLRRKKAGKEVHFVTLDAGAPNCHIAPVIHTTASVHHQTHVGAPVATACH